MPNCELRNFYSQLVWIKKNLSFQDPESENQIFTDSKSDNEILRDKTGNKMRIKKEG